MTRYALVAAGLVLAAFALWHAAPRPPGIVTAASPDARPARSGRHPRPSPSSSAAIVYVAGAVRRPGLYTLRWGERAAAAVEQAGGFADGADQAGVNLAARVADGEEIEVPRAGESRRTASRTPRSRRASETPPEASVDVNSAETPELARVPGIGRAIAQRIVELRSRDGSFASLDELLDVAGMTPARLDRARPFLREP